MEEKAPILAQQKRERDLIARQYENVRKRSSILRVHLSAPEVTPRNPILAYA